MALARTTLPREHAHIVAAYFAVFLGTGVWVPYMPLWLASLGFDGWQVGILGGMQPALRWASAICVAAAADRWRRRHALLIGCALLGGLSFVPLLWATSFEAVLPVLATIALLQGSLIPLLDAVALDALARSGGDYGRLRMAGSVAFVIGAFGSAPLLDVFSPSLIPVLLLVPQLVLVPAMMRLPREQHGHAADARPPWALLTPPLRAFLATAFLLQISCGAWGGFFAIHTAALGLSDAVPGLAWGLPVTAEIILFGWGRRLVGRFEPADLVLVVLVTTVIRWALTAVVTSEPLVVAVQMGHAVTFSVFHLATMTLLARLVPSVNSTSGQGLYGLVAFGGGSSLGFLLAGALVDRLGTQRLFAVEAVIAALALLPAWHLRALLRAGAARFAPTAVAR
jgi:MFS transporter, PPP family, 3-phenylpropionic acid transporter